MTQRPLLLSDYHRNNNAWRHWLVKPIFVTIRLVYDSYIEVEVATFTGCHGVGAGFSLAQTMVAAVETLLYLDSIIDLPAAQ